MQDVPVVYLVFDLLYAGEELLSDQPLRERAGKLEKLLAAPRKPIPHRDTEVQRKTGNLQSRLEFALPTSTSATTDDRDPRTDVHRTDAVRHTTFSPMAENQEHRARIMRAPVCHASSPEELNQLFDAAQARGNEGLMIKDPESPYTPGRRGKSWLKQKRELATLDVVVTAVEWGHGKRIGVLSDYTFAVRDGDRLLNVGKAYSGLTDAEIAEMTQWFLERTIEDQGFRRTVEPNIVLEVAFNNVMKSDRHNSGYALRFPRIVRLRPDKLPEEADTLNRVKEIYGKQTSGHSSAG
jgi:ATP-dependent DNA ligase